MDDHWSVTVRRNGEEVVTIESDMLSGREISAEDEWAICTAGHHLLAFIGSDGTPPELIDWDAKKKAADFTPPPVLGDSCVRRTWIIVREPNRVPQKKSPPDQSPSGVETFLRELIACRPEGTKFTLARLTHDFDLWVDDGPCELEIGDALRDAECNGHERVYEDGAGYVCRHCGIDCSKA